MIKRLYNTGLLPALGGLAVLVIAMGVGRFAYTALLPSMMHAHALGEKATASMAAWNYAGYLAGVLAMRKETAGQSQYAKLQFFLLLSILSTAAMGLVHGSLLWYTTRLIAGFASGACFVLCSALVLDALITIGRPFLSGLMYSGVGIGIVLSAIAVRPFEALFGSDGTWIGLAILCIPLACAALLCLRPRFNPPSAAPAHAAKAMPANNRTPATQWTYPVLLLTYFLEGFGYIIGTTFLVSLTQTRTHSAELANAAWIVTGCAAALSTPLWRYTAQKSYLRMLVLAFLLQGLGVLLPVFSNHPVVILTGGLLLGGTFMGITALSLQYGVVVRTSSSAYTIAMLTTVYGVGQILGPIVAGVTVNSHGFAPAFILAAFSLFLAATLLAIHDMMQRQ